MTTDSAASTDSASATRTRLIMTGGFLGAGKTTLLLRLGEWLSSRGLRVGLVTNDQAGGLVDTSLGRAHDLAVEEIAGGCLTPRRCHAGGTGVVVLCAHLPAEHVSGVLPAEKTLSTKPPHQPAAYPLGAVTRSDAVRGRAA